ncbi:PulJ/GspJ family protein [Pseudoalteromonas sp. T1lg23B]|uniref:PulJ/GspJ family protein n=1 Tax=Pseudoalteromonas sp. T1lg23B TaxID=2077097 RepID=UPI001319C01D|nr:type II secretion system protein [Pseudoalteromonas sp. T1lg23B]
MNNNNTKGFTLVEVLIAMTIFSMVIALAVMSYRFSLQQLTKEQANHNIEQLSRVKLVNRTIREATPFGYHNELRERVPFFIGTRSSFSFINRSPILISSPMSIATLYLAEQEIRYCETPFGSTALEHYRFDSDNCEQSLTFMTVKTAQFEYYAWKDWLELSNYYSSYMNVAIKPVPRWSTDFDASKRRIMPLFVRLKISEENAEQESQLIYKLMRVPPSLFGAGSV